MGHVTCPWLPLSFYYPPLCLEENQTPHKYCKRQRQGMISSPYKIEIFLQAGRKSPPSGMSSVGYFMSKLFGFSPMMHILLRHLRMPPTLALYTSSFIALISALTVPPSLIYGSDLLALANISKIFPPPLFPQH